MFRSHIAALVLAISVVSAPAFAQCNSAIIFTADADEDIDSNTYNIYIADLCQNEFSQLTSDDTSYDPAISPDGQQIVFTSDYHIDIMNIDGTNRRILSGAALVYPRYPVWSPNGQYVTFAAYAASGESSRLYIVRANGGNLHQLAVSNGSATASMWSPDGSRIAFVTHQGESQHSIYIINVGDGQLRQVELPVGRYLEDVIAWSPDGAQIAYVGSHQLYLLDIESLSSQLVSTFYHSGSPSWSPDGSQLVFEGIESQDSMWGIYLMNVAAGAITPLFSGEGRWPVWSPDGQRIVFVGALENDVSWSLYTINADGLNLTRIPQPENASSSEPVWLP